MPELLTVDPERKGMRRPRQLLVKIEQVYLRGDVVKFAARWQHRDMHFKRIHDRQVGGLSISQWLHVF